MKGSWLISNLNVIFVLSISFLLILILMLIIGSIVLMDQRLLAIAFTSKVFVIGVDRVFTPQRRSPLLPIIEIP